MSERAKLERLLAPELLAALDGYVRELVDERVAALAEADGREWLRLEEARSTAGEADMPATIRPSTSWQAILHGRLIEPEVAAATIANAMVSSPRAVSQLPA